MESGERPPLAVRLAAQRLLGEGGLDGMAEEGLYVAPWGGSAKASLPIKRAQAYSPPVMGSHAALVAVHPEGMGVVIAPSADDETRLELAANSVILTPTSSRYRLTARGGSIQLVVVACTQRVPHTAKRQPMWQGVPTEGDKAEDVTEGGVPVAMGEAVEEPGAVPQSVAAERGPGESVEPRGDELDVEAHVGAALARVLAAAGGPPAASGAREAEQGVKGSQGTVDVVPMDDDELVRTGGQATPGVQPRCHARFLGFPFPLLSPYRYND